MSQVQRVMGSGIVLKGDDIDTDRIIPARFLKCVTFDGIGVHVFEDDRIQLKGAHPFDQEVYKNAKILVVNRNFGCGSSREHAPQAIARWGIQAIVGESFAEIFFGNCVAMGVPCVTAESNTVQQLQDAIATNPQLELNLDLMTMTVTGSDITATVTIGDGPRQMFLGGTWDACGQLIAQSDAIQAIAAKLPYVDWSNILKLAST